MPANVSPPRPTVCLEAVSKSYLHRRSRRWVQALEDVSLDLHDDEVLCLLGPSGCGKSTILNIVAGFESASAGRVELAGRPIVKPGPERGVVFQEHGLFPWLTVEQNVAFGPRVRHRKASHSQINDALDLVGMGRFASAYPHELSGGMRQRVSIARALINEPRILLIDEPFGALDALTRLKMQQLLVDIITARPTTVLFVTHDINEALLLGDRIVVMTPQPGKILREVRLAQPRPRTAETLEAPDMLATKHEITALLLAEHDSSGQQTT